MKARYLAFTLIALSLSLPVHAQQAQQAPPPGIPATLDNLNRLTIPPVRETGGTLFENVAKVMRERFVDRKFREEQLPAIIEKYRERARETATLDGQRQVVHEMLSHVPASHLGLLSTSTHRALFADLLRVALPNFGFQLIGAGDSYYAGMVLENGPAIRSGLLTGDRIVTVDGVPVEKSPRLDWRSDDSYFADDRDPAVRQLIAAAGDRIELRVERRPGEFLNVAIPAEEYSAFDAARASTRIIRRDGRSFGYLHFWFVHLSGVPELLKEKIEGEFKGVDGLIIDLRGRGGSATEVTRIVALVKGVMTDTKLPIVALVDRQSRSGKDILAYEFKEMGVRLVGEPSAGAVIPAMFADVGHDSILMFPTFRLQNYTDKLEFNPVQPHVLVERPGLFAAGRDAILEAGVAEFMKLIEGRLEIE